MPVDRNPTVRRRRLGAELRHLRERAGFTAEAVASRLGCSDSKISRIENARSAVRPPELRTLLALYGVVDPETVESYLMLAKEGRTRGWWTSYRGVLSPLYADYIALESDAREACDYEPNYVPGLLQTPDYALAVMGMSRLAPTPGEAEKLVEVRMARQRALHRQAPLDLRVVVSESALRRPIGGPGVMRRQLRCLAERCGEAHIALQVLPERETAHAAAPGAFVILRFPTAGDRDVVYLDNLTSTLYVESTEEVELYGRTFDYLRAAALSLEASAELVEVIARDL